jgi:hypothetical protein
MSNYYSTSLSLILQNAGENSTTWGSFVNTNFQTLLEQAIVGQTTISMANADYTLTSSQGVSNEARNAVLIISGNQNATYSVIVPAVPKLYIITNNLSSSATAYLKVTGSSTSFSVANGNTVMVYCTGSNSGTAFYAVNYVANAGTAATATTATTASGLTGTPNITVGTVNGTTISASTQFSGPGTGLTGTASSLTVGNSTNATNATYANQLQNSGGWNVTPSGTKLYFNYNGTNVASLDSSGNLITLGSHTAGGTP